MKLAGFLLLVAGWGIVLASLALLKTVPARTAFVLSGVAVEMLGMGIVMRSYIPPRGEQR